MSGPNKILTESHRESCLFSWFRILVNRYNHSVASKHISSNPQLAIFSFDHIGLRINLDGRYENRTLLLVKSFLAQLNIDFGGTVALDIGANIGNHSVFFSDIFGSVYSFEPNPYAFELLKINSRFSCPRKNIEVRNYGLSNKNTKTLLSVNRSNIGGSSIVIGVEKPGDNEVLIEVRKLDTIDELREVAISLIKIDVEGYELQALMGAEELLSRNRPVILFEQQSKEIEAGSSPVINFLLERNYRFATIEQKFYFGEVSWKKALSLCLRLLFGSKLTIVGREHFEKKFYEMIIAIPR
jgi:FkbM family methyltransferase